MRFIKPNDLSIIENENEFILRKGFLHINEIVIDKLESSADFIKSMNEFAKNGSIDLKETNSVYEDFLQLMSFDLINIESRKNFLLIINENYKKIIRQLCKENVCIKTIEDMFDKSDIALVTENKDIVKLNLICQKYKKDFEGYDHIYLIDEFYNTIRIRAFNRMMNILEIENTIGFLDNNNIYLTGIKPKYTGCYECLERHIITKFPNRMADYIREYKENKAELENKSDICLLMGLVLKDMDNINSYGSSSLTGNVIHFYTPNFEYSFNANRRNCSCLVCAGVNNTIFEEQNIRSVNIIREAALNDKI